MFNFLERHFQLKANGTTLRKEVLGGLTSFFTLAYTLILIPSLLAKTGMDFGAVLVSTALVGAYSSFLMGTLANYPFVLAPGIALAAYFTYSAVLGHNMSWQVTLGVVFLTGILLLLLNLLRIRQLIIRVIPYALRVATTAGLGLFLALIGLKNAGIIVAHPSTLLSFGDPRSIQLIMTASGLVIIALLMLYRVPGAFFIGMLIIWSISRALRFIPWKGLVSLPESIGPIFFKLDVVGAFHFPYVGALISFLFVALFDSTGTLVGLAEEGGFIRHGETTFPRVSRALMPDTTGTILSSLLGVSPVAVYLESAAGIHAGGRTGLTAVVAAILFLGALFFIPFATSMPFFATSPVLVIIGGMMLKKVGYLNWEDPSEWIPAFVTIILIPLTSSVANGIASGFLIYAVIKLLGGKFREVHWFTWVLSVFFLLKFIFFPEG